MYTLNLIPQSEKQTDKPYRNLYYDFSLQEQNNNTVYPSAMHALEKYKELETVYLFREKRKNYSRQLMDILAIPNELNLSKTKQVHTTDDKEIMALFQLCNVNYICPISGETLFFNAARNNHINIIRALIHCGVNINHQNKEGNNVLMVTCSRYINSTINCKNEIIELLINNGAEIYVRNQKGYNTLFYCIINNNIVVIKMLLDKALLDKNSEVLNDIHNQLRDYKINDEINALMLQYEEQYKDI